MEENRLIITYLGIYKEKISLSFFSLKNNKMSRAPFDLTQPPIKFNKVGFGNVYLRPRNSAEDFTCGITWAKLKGNEN